MCQYFNIPSLKGKPNLPIVFTWSHCDQDDVMIYTQFNRLIIKEHNIEHYIYCTFSFYQRFEKQLPTSGSCYRIWKLLHPEDSSKVEALHLTVTKHWLWRLLLYIDKLTSPCECCLYSSGRRVLYESLWWYAFTDGQRTQILYLRNPLVKINIIQVKFLHLHFCSSKSFKCTHIL